MHLSFAVSECPDKAIALFYVSRTSKVYLESLLAVLPLQEACNGRQEIFISLRLIVSSRAQVQAGRLQFLFLSNKARGWSSCSFSYLLKQVSLI